MQTGINRNKNTLQHEIIEVPEKFKTSRVLMLCKFVKIFEIYLMRQSL